MNSMIIAGIGLLAIGIVILKTGKMGGIGGPFSREDYPFIVNFTIIAAFIGGVTLIIRGLIN